MSHGVWDILQDPTLHVHLLTTEDPPLFVIFDRDNCPICTDEPLSRARPATDMFGREISKEDFLRPDTQKGN